jgi:hypothetical protein
MAAQVLGQRVHDDVGALFERPAQVGAGHGVVDDQRHAVAVRHRGQRRQVGDVALRVAQALDEDRLGAAVDQRLEARRVAVVGEADLDAVLRQRVCEQVVGAAVQRRRRHDVVARLGDGLHRIGDRRLPRGERQRRDAALERGQALLQHRLRGVHDAGVDVARHLEVEQVGTMLGAVERIGHRLVQRHGHRVRGRLGGVAGVDHAGLEAPAAGVTGHEVSSRRRVGGRKLAACR